MREPNDTSMLHVKKCANVPTREGYKVHGWEIGLPDWFSFFSEVTDGSR